MKTFREFANQRSGITVTYRAVDGFKKTARFHSLPEAQAFAQKYVGETPEFGRGYAVSGDGVGKVTANGATLAELFPKAAEVDRRDDEDMPSFGHADEDLPPYGVNTMTHDAWAMDRNARADREAEAGEYDRSHPKYEPKPKYEPRPNPDIPF